MVLHFKNIGIMKYSNGDKYDGNWINDAKNGQGKMEYANGDIYNGRWKNDKRYGQGKEKIIL